MNRRSLDSECQRGCLAAAKRASSLHRLGAAAAWIESTGAPPGPLT